MKPWCYIVWCENFARVIRMRYWDYHHSSVFNDISFSCCCSWSIRLISLVIIYGNSVYPWYVMRTVFTHAVFVPIFINTVWPWVKCQTEIQGHSTKYLSSISQNCHGHQKRSKSKTASPSADASRDMMTKCNRYPDGLLKQKKDTRQKLRKWE